jgi:hypothetical protein
MITFCVVDECVTNLKCRHAQKSAYTDLYSKYTTTTTRQTFSEVSDVVALIYSKYTRALTFEIFFLMSAASRKNGRL